MGLSRRPRAGAAAFGTILVAAGLLAAALSPAEAARRGKTRFDGIRDCERTATLQFMRQSSQFRHFSIDRSHVAADRYAAQVGNRFISTVYHGRAVYDGGAGARATRFVCLHGGLHRRAVFFYLLPD